MGSAILHAACESWGLCPLDGCLEQHLGLDARDFGSAIQEVCVTIHFGGPFDSCSAWSAPGTVSSSLRDLHASFAAGSSKLPRRRFERARQRLTIDFDSRALDRAFLVAAWPKATLDALVNSGARLPGRAGPLSVLEANAALLDEVIEELRACAPKLGSRDDFRLQDALEWLAGRRRALPTTSEEYFALKRQAGAAAAVTDAALDEWDRLEVDLRDFHPDARRLLDSPYFWSCVDEFAPHGNDAGADLLDLLQRWRKPHGRGDSRSRRPTSTVVASRRARHRGPTARGAWRAS